MLDQGITDPETQRALGTLIVDDFNQMLINVRDSLPPLADGRPALVHVDCRGAISPPSEWQNEMHPTVKGFEELAARFVDPLVALGHPRLLVQESAPREMRRTRTIRKRASAVV